MGIGTGTAAGLELEQVVKHYHGAEEVRAVDGVSLTIAPGEMVALYGPSGSGKTTLLLLIAALLTAEEGSIRYAGRDLASLSANEASDYLLRDVGFIFQAFHLMPTLRAIDNVQVPMLAVNGNQTSRADRAEALLVELGLQHRLTSYPNELSAGERQRVAIARALANKPAILLADEPTGNLDSQTGEEIMALFAKLHEEGNTILLVTHEPDIAARAHRVIRVRDGKVEHDERTR